LPEGSYNRGMARGWESKSVEEQQAESAARWMSPRPMATADQLVRQKREQDLKLARVRVMQQIQRAQNPRYRKLLEGALADLDAKLAALG
jgi:hypothetical protein